MPFDAELVLHDGTQVTGDITPTSIVRSSGSAVIDLITQSPPKGLAAILILTADLAETSDTLLITIEESSAANGTYVEMARFPLLTKGTGMPGTYILRFNAEERYIRAKIVTVDDDSGPDFTATFYVLLANHPFFIL